jgi:hypothetical protein
LRGVSYYAMEAAARPPMYFGGGTAQKGRADPQHQTRGLEG